MHYSHCPRVLTSVCRCETRPFLSQSRVCPLSRFPLTSGLRQTRLCSHRLTRRSQDLQPCTNPGRLHCKRQPLTRSTRTMASAAARLARLRSVVQSDLDALPHRPAHEPEVLSDEDTPGGITLNDTQSKQPTPASVADLTPASAQALPVVPKKAPKETIEENSERRFVWKQGAASSYNLGSSPTLAALSTTKLPPTDLQKGELAQQNYFTPIVALSKYPYQFCNKSCMQDIASAFFDTGKFWTREWDL
jgi:hypothetical protein